MLICARFSANIFVSWLVHDCVLHDFPVYIPSDYTARRLRHQQLHNPEIVNYCRILSWLYITKRTSIKIKYDKFLFSLSTIVCLAIALELFSAHMYCISNGVHVCNYNGMQLKMTTDLHESVRRDSQCCGREGSVAGHTNINWTKTAHLTCAHLGLVLIHICTYTIMELRLSTGPTEGLSSSWPSDRSSPTSNNNVEWIFVLLCVVLQRHMELTTDQEKTSRSALKSKLKETSSQLMAVQLRETSLAVEVKELKQEALQLETAVSWCRQITSRTNFNLNRCSQLLFLSVGLISLL